MRKHNAKGYVHGQQGRSIDKPHGILDFLLSESKEKSRMNRENNDYVRGFYEGRKDRDRGGRK